MKTICVISPNEIVIEERPIPRIQLANDVLLKVKAGDGRFKAADLITHRFPLIEIHDALH